MYHSPARLHRSGPSHTWLSDKAASRPLRGVLAGDAKTDPADHRRRLDPGLPVSVLVPIPSFFSCNGGHNRKRYLCERELDRQMKRASALELESPAQAARLWTRIDHELVDRAVWVPTVNIPETGVRLSAGCGTTSTNRSGASSPTRSGFANDLHQDLSPRGKSDHETCGHLPSMEVLCAPGALCSSQDGDAAECWGQVLGTGCGASRALGVHVEATKKAICWPFVKPSDGLEPSTPSLPWRCSTN